MVLKDSSDSLFKFKNHSSLFLDFVKMSELLTKPDAE